MHTDNQAQPLDAFYDVIIIGAGVVGCAMTRRFALAGAKVLLLEKSSDILDGASKGNSAILHTGFDAPIGSLEQQCIADGYREFMEIRDNLKLPVLKTGALVIARTVEEENKLSELIEQAHQNNVLDVKQLSAAEILGKEPNLSPNLKGGFHIPQEFLIDPWTSPYLYLVQALESGATLLRNAEVHAGYFENAQWHLTTNQGAVKSTTVINCAGLYGDKIDAALVNKTSFDIKPRKGQFIVYDKVASKLLTSIILPVPTKTTKGVVVCRTIYGNVLVGPTADEQESRDDASVDRDTLQFLKSKGEEILPELAECTITATYAGIRPATQFKEYCIKPYDHENYISVGGIRSTGLSAALGIANHVFKLYENMGHNHKAVENLTWPTATPIAEHCERDWQKPGNGGIVCHCELVTKREVEAALTGPIPATSLAALKRRTRVTMGRCQGFYCSGNLSEITEKHFTEPLGVDDANH